MKMFKLVSTNLEVFVEQVHEGTVNIKLKRSPSTIEQITTAAIKSKLFSLQGGDEKKDV